MKKIVAVALFAVSTLAVPAALVATPANALTCGVDAPAEWERPGGFCDALKSTGSLTTPVEAAPAAKVVCVGDATDMMMLVRDLDIGERIRLADIDPCAEPE